MTATKNEVYDMKSVVGGEVLGSGINPFSLMGDKNLVGESQWLKAINYFCTNA